VVTTRSVLIFVQHKHAAFREFHRVLRPGGRVSIFEPINNYFPDDMDDFWGFDAAVTLVVWVFRAFAGPSFGRSPATHRGPRP